MSPRMDDDEQKRIVKEALKEWLNEKFTEFGKWSLLTAAATAFAALTYFVLWANGWHK